MGSLTWSIMIAAKDPAALSLAKGPASKGPTKIADRRRGRPSVAACGHLNVVSSGVAGNSSTVRGSEADTFESAAVRES